MSDQVEQKDETEPEKTWEDYVTGRCRLFVLTYCTDEACFMNGTRSYQKAYRKRNKDGVIEEPSDEVAAVCASKLLRKAKVKQSCRLLLRLALNESDEAAVYRTVHLYDLLANYNPADIITIEGELKCKSLEELGELAKCISQIERKADRNGDIYLNIKLVDRRGYVQDYAKYLNIIRDEALPGTSVPVVILHGTVDENHWESISAAAADKERALAEAHIETEVPVE